MKAETTSFVTIDGTMEVMMTELTNTADQEQKITPVAVIPLYGRSADNIRDHRHVTSLLHRIETKTYGVEVCPVLSFDERGHQKIRRSILYMDLQERERRRKILSDNGNVYRGRGKLPESRSGKNG